MANRIPTKELLNDGPLKSTLSGTEQLWFDDAGIAKRGSAIDLLATKAVQADVTSKIAPFHWYNATTLNTVQSGGLVDTLTDIGSGGKNLTQVGAARAPLATDGAGQEYLALDGANDYYQAVGVAADWTFANNGTDCTIAYIGSRAALATGSEDMVGTGGSNTTLNGFDLYWNYVSAGDQGPWFVVARSTLNNYVVFVETSFLAVGPLWVLIVRTGGTVPPPRIQGLVTSNTIAAKMSMNNIERAICNRNAALTYNAGAPNFVLTLGRRADLAAGQFSNVRTYDVIVDNKAWTDEQCDVFYRYARTRGVG